MPPKPNHSNKKRLFILRMVKDKEKGQSKVSRIFRIPKSTINSIIKKFKITGKVSKL